MDSNYVGKVVEVEWDDIWTDVEEHEAKDWDNVCRYRTFGLCVSDEPDILRVAQDVYSDNKNFRSVGHIWKSVIRKVTVYAAI